MGPILLFTQDVTAASAEIARVGGRILHVLTPSVVVAEVPEGAVLAASTTVRPGDLDQMSARLADAWRASLAKTGPTEVLPWDAPGKEGP